MKTNNIVLCFSLMFLIVFVSSCTPSTENATNPSPVIRTVPAGSATSTLIPVVNDTPTAIPTLPVEEASKRLLDLLANNGDCRFPCLWGIVMGKSTYQEAQVILSSLSSISELTSFTPEGGAIFPVYKQVDLEIYVTVGFLTNPSDGIVNHIAFNTEARRLVKDSGYENAFDSKFFGEKASAYALSHVLSEQGTPSSVMIATAGGPLTRGGTGGFAILLLYPDQGILVNYTTQMHLIGTNVRGCPVNAHIEMELYPMGSTDSFFEMLEQTDWAIKFDYYKPLEEVTSMSINEFYQTFRESTEKCIETPANLWATPEP